MAKRIPDYILSKSMLVFLRNRNRDKCYFCNKLLKEGDNIHAIVSDNRRKQYHQKCWKVLLH
jgi:hypothetical protein